ncbi:hypothetical protein [Prauserella cavernicola]|uniref:Uncharacterized protein n=1 Tax=Prauserella cavernicola TaxID=2800127 RepID=A0A934QXG9_9PSEU|nr:hypothetical protein [Prauserella cavernicola]MBK1788286.1 hypothetical protein [Prauserella cavernicola]
MTTMPELARPLAGPVSVTGGGRIMLGDGRSVRVVSSYPVRGGIELHSLAASVEFECAHCHTSCEATLVAVQQGFLVCPSCYPVIGSGRAPGIEGFRPCRASSPGGKLYSFAR